MEKGFYHPSAGYWQTTTTPSADTLAQYPDGTVEVPLKPGIGYTYSGSNWVPPSAEWLYEHEAANVRVRRNALLRREVDPVVSNPLRWAGLSAEQRAAWADYRIALLNISTQPGFPHNVSWPAKPLT